MQEQPKTAQNAQEATQSGFYYVVYTYNIKTKETRPQAAAIDPNTAGAIEKNITLNNSNLRAYITKEIEAPAGIAIDTRSADNLNELLNDIAEDEERRKACKCCENCNRCIIEYGIIECKADEMPEDANTKTFFCDKWI